MMNKTNRQGLLALAAAGVAVLGLSACATPASGPTEPAQAQAGVTAEGPRVALTYDGGLLVLDGTSLTTLADIDLAGFNRLNSAGDGRSVMVSTADGFQVLDTAAAGGGAPQLTDLVFDATTPGHVVRHDGKTILFDDGTGETSIFASDELLARSGSLPQTELVPAPEPHHGVSIETADGTLLSTIGTPDGRSGVRVLAPAEAGQTRAETARNEQCPSVHGEGAVANEVIVFGCSDGVLVYDAGTFTKITAPDAFGRTGNAYVSETSPIMVGDYNSDPDSEGYELSELALIDTSAKTSRVIDMPDGAKYTWRDVARTADDNALVIGTDGALHVLDVATGEFTSSFPVIDEWEGPAEWQDAHPALVVMGDTAYVTDPATKSVHAVDVKTGKIMATGSLSVTPNEIAVVTG